MPSVNVQKACDPEVIAEFIDDAADYMEKHGSISGALNDEYGRVCILGAFGKITVIDMYDGFKKYNHRTLRVAQERLALFISTNHHILPGGNGLIACFNDTHTHQERLDALRKCAKGLRP